MEKNILYKLLNLSTRGIRVVFVIDGPGRPKIKRGKEQGWDDPKHCKLLLETAQLLCIPVRKAPAEAEAECAALERAGLVDAVWTEDSDAFLYGAQDVVRFHHESQAPKPTNGEASRDNGAKLKDFDAKSPISKTHVQLLRAEDLGLEGDVCHALALYAILAGGDYSNGLPGIGPKKAKVELLKKTNNDETLATALFRASKEGKSALIEWSQEFRKVTQFKIRDPADV
jgi:holliday junction resolvase YEN1